jgi:hypothetical protein
MPPGNVEECRNQAVHGRWLVGDDYGPQEALMGASGNDTSSLEPNSGGDEDG